MNEVYVLVGKLLAKAIFYTKYDLVIETWLVCVYPDKEMAFLHCELLNNIYKNSAKWLHEPSPGRYKAIQKAKYLDIYTRNRDNLKTVYSIEKVVFALHPDDYKDKLGL